MASLLKRALSLALGFAIASTTTSPLLSAMQQPQQSASATATTTTANAATANTTTQGSTTSMTAHTQTTSAAMNAGVSQAITTNNRVQIIAQLNNLLKESLQILTEEPAELTALLNDTSLPADNPTKQALTKLLEQSKTLKADLAEIDEAFSHTAKDGKTPTKKI